MLFVNCYDELNNNLQQAQFDQMVRELELERKTISKKIEEVSFLNHKS